MFGLKLDQGVIARSMDAQYELTFTRSDFIDHVLAERNELILGMLEAPRFECSAHDRVGEGRSRFTP